MDLGFGGACIELPEGAARGDLLMVSFVSPSLWDPLTIPARVAWIDQAGNPARAGLTFEHRDPSAVYALFELMSTSGFDP